MEDFRRFVELQPGQFAVRFRPAQLVLWFLAVLGAITLLIAVAGCQPARAQSYIRIDAAGAQFAPTSFTTPIGSASLKAKTGEAVSLAFGYRFNPNLAAEIEAGYSHAGLSTVSGLLSGPVSGTTNTFTGFANALYTPFPGKTQPYIGAGIGFAKLRASIDSIAAVPVGLSENKTSFAAQAIAGIDFSLTDRLTLGARYRYLWIDNAQNFVFLGTSVHQEAARAHLLSASLTYRF